jgi:integrase
VPKINLTDLTVRSLQPPEQGQVVYYDASLRGFGVRVSQGGSKTFVLQTGPKNKRVRHVLGRYPDVTLAEARAHAKKITSELTLNQRPTATQTFKSALATYIDTHCLQLSAAHKTEVTRTLNTHFLPKLGAKLLTNIESGDVTKILDALVKVRPSEANHAHTNLKTFLNWCVRRNLIAYSPIALLSLPSRTVERDRVLSDDELRKVYLAATEVGHPFGFFCLIAIHTGLRRGNIAAMEWSWITDEHITIPAPAMKSEKSFVLPNLINENLKLIPRDHARYVFASEAGTPLSAFSKHKRKLDQLCQVENWTLHDLRRTFRSKLSEWRCCSSDIAERLIDHAPQSKVERIYDRWHYLPEMREALTHYEGHLARLIS